MTASPKARFMAEDRLQKQFLDVVDSEAFQRASELSMLQLQSELATSEVDSGHAFERIRGAQRFLEILKTLPEQSKVPSAPRSHQLDHDLR